MEKRPALNTIKIAVTGPESSGKSELAARLAATLNAALVREYAREYLDALGRQYAESDLTEIALGQINLEDQALRLKPEIMVCDTELTVIRIWALHKYGRSPAIVEGEIDSRSYDLYLLCNNDIPWEADPQRENPGLRDYFFEWYHREMTDRKLAFTIVRGCGEERFLSAYQAVKELLNQKLR
jgi:NadR type nicotinamide-nucleotide adenylyltransferase